MISIDDLDLILGSLTALEARHPGDAGVADYVDRARRQVLNEVDSSRPWREAAAAAHADYFEMLAFRYSERRILRWIRNGGG